MYVWLWNAVLQSGSEEYSITLDKVVRKMSLKGETFLSLEEHGYPSHLHW